MESLLRSPEGQRTLRICIFVLIVSYQSWQCGWFLGVSVLSHLVMTWLLVFVVSHSPVVSSVHIGHSTNQNTHYPLLLVFSQDPRHLEDNALLCFFCVLNLVFLTWGFVSVCKFCEFAKVDVGVCVLSLSAHHVHDNLCIQYSLIY